MKSPRYIVAALSVALFSALAVAGVIERTVPVGSVVDVNGKVVATITSDKTVLVRLPGGDDVLLKPAAVTPPPVIEEPPPTTKPTEPPPPSTQPGDVIVVDADIVIRKGQPLKGPSAPGTAEDPVVVAVERGGVWNGTIHLSKSHVYYVAFGTGDAPKIKGDTGIRIYSNVQNVRVNGFDFDASAVPADKKGNGITAQNVNGVRDLVIENNWFREHHNGASIHTSEQVNYNSRYWHNVDIRHNRFLDPKGSGQKSGHGLFIQGVKGLRFFENFIDGAGRNKRFIDIYAHAFYLQAGGLEVEVERNLIGWSESVGLQVRGPDMNYKARKHDSDPGPVVVGNVIVNPAVGIIANGYRVTVIGNVIAKPHFHNAPLRDNGRQRHGQGGIQVHAGNGVVADNTRYLHGSADPLSTDTKSPNFEYRMPAFEITSRGSGGDTQWPWGGSTANVVRRNNVDSIRKVEFDDLIRRAREGENIGQLVDEAHGRVAVSR